MDIEKIKNDLKIELKNNAVRYGDFTLASGQKSKYYVNCKTVTLDAYGSYLSGAALLSIIDEKSSAVGGLTLGADPLISSITVISHLEKRPLKGFIVRKETKGHGTQNQIENAPEAGSAVVIVDDVITTGGSALKAAKVAIDLGLNVVQAISLVDRGQGGKEAFEELGVSFKALFKIDELLDQDKIKNI